MFLFLAILCYYNSIMIKVFGHLSPDTDSAGSAILWAWFLQNHTSTEAEAFVLGELNKETKFILNRWGIAEPKFLDKIESSDELVIVDTNVLEELLPGVNDAKIIQVIDHHRLAGGLQTKSPVNLTIRPYASTASVIYGLLESSHIENMPENMAGLMLSCILSDTLGFRSPTTTPHDKDVAEKLAARLNMDIPQYTDEMLRAKSDVSDFTDLGLIKIDSKKVTLGGSTVRVSVLETTCPQIVLDRKAGIVKAIGELINEESDLHDVLFFVIDILKEEAHCFTYNDYTKKIIADSFKVAVETDIEVLPGILSRKKQILPALLSE